MIARRHRRHRRRNGRGFTLIELMISLVLFTLAITGVLSVAVSMTVAFSDQRQAIATETSVRAPLDYISDAIRNASPAVPSGDVTDTQGSCVKGAIIANDSLVGPDVLTVTFASGAVVTSLRSIYDDGTNGSNATITVTDGSGITAGDTLLITDGAAAPTSKGHLVHVTGVVGGPSPATVNLSAAAGCSGLAASQYVPGALVIRVQRVTFSVDDTGICCDGVPALMMDPDGIDGPLLPEPLAENIEDMQVAYGIDANANGGIDDPAEWSFSSGIGPLAGAIRAVRVTLIARTQNQLIGPATFARPAAENRPAGGADAYRRRVLSSTVEVRNLGGSP